MSLAHRIAPLSYAVRPRVVAKLLGQLAWVLALLNMVPAAVATGCGERRFAAAALAACAALSVVGLVTHWLPRPNDVQVNEAMVTIALTFLAAALANSYPFAAGGMPPWDALFEAVSAVTTTGLTMLVVDEHHSVALLFARAWAQWCGGLGFVVFSVVLLVLEPGIATRRLSLSEGEHEPMSSIRTHARSILVIYLIMTAIGIAALTQLRVDPYTALLHTLAAVSTGGFSTYGNGLADLGGPLVQTTVMLLALAGAVSLHLYLRAVRYDWREFAANLELRGILVGTLLAGAVLYGALGEPRASAAEPAALHALLIALSAQTGAGFSTFPVASLGAPALAVLLLVMLAGGSTGSTSGGVKMLRVLIVLRMLQLHLLRSGLPRHAVVEPWLGRERLARGDIEPALLTVYLFLLTVVASWIPFLALGHPPLESLFEVVSATATVGLSAGIADSALDTGLKWLLCLDMLLGRLEIVAFVVLVLPGTWIGRRRGSS